MSRRRQTPIDRFDQRVLICEQRGVQVNFQEALIELQRVRPEAQIGLTAQRGQYYDQAVHMSFRSYDALHFVAVGRHGKEMWLYVNENLGRICCGNKS